VEIAAILADVDKEMDHKHTVGGLIAVRSLSDKVVKTWIQECLTELQSKILGNFHP
jgi:hypothetical protein